MCSLFLPWQWLPTLLAAGFLLMSAGCIPTKQARVAAVGLTIQDVAKAAARQPDLTILREGTPAYLMLIDGLIEAYPQNRELLIAASQSYSAYASTFSDEEQERAEPLYRRARHYGFRALSNGGDFQKTASGNLDEFRAYLERYGKKDVPALFWTTSAWATWVSMNVDSVEAMGDLPALEVTMRRTIELDESFYYGGPHLLMGVYLAAKPAMIGGDLNRARYHFDRAFALGGDKVLMGKVFFAQYYARGINDRELYVRTLQEVLDAPADNPPELTLSNTMAKQKARRLLDKTEEYFGSQPLS